MTTIRIARRRRFVRLDSRSVNDGRLSFRARGVLAWLLDKPDDWTVNAEAIAGHGTEGRDAIRTVLKELEEAGYLVRRKWHDDNGRWASEAVLYEHPEDAEDGADEDTDQGGFSAPVSQRRGTSAGDPGPIHNTPKGVSTHDSNTTPLPLDVDDGFDAFWEAYPVKFKKADARAKWPKAVKKARRVEVLVDAACRYRDDPNREDQYTAYAPTWLNRERWNDPPLPSRTGRNGHAPPNAAVWDAEADARLRAMPDELLDFTRP